MPNPRGEAAGAAIIGVGYGAWMLGGWGGPGVIRVLDDVGLVFFALLATGCAGWAASRLTGRDRVAWTALAVGTACWAVGQAIWTHHDLVGGVVAVPSLADAGFMSFQVGAGVALVVMLTADSAGKQVRTFIDGLIVAAAIFGAAWVVLLKAVYAARDSDVLAMAVSLVYPVADIALITVGGLILMRATVARRTWLALLTAGLVALACSDTAFVYLTATNSYHTDHELAFGWVIGMLLIGLSALRSVRNAAADSGARPAAVSDWLPYVPVSLSAVLCAPVLLAGLGPVFVAVAVILIAVTIRQALILGENRRLRAGIVDQAARPVILDELQHAIDHSGLRVVYQPMFDLQTRAVVGAEALVRWPHPCHGMLGPDEFLPLVRQRGLMDALTAEVLELALDEAARWHAAGFRIPVSVNVFAPTISDPKLGRTVLKSLRKRGLPPDALTVEITEDRLLADLSGTRSALDMLRNNGIRVALDDFGSGYSALWYLRDFPVDQVKLDRDFIAPILTHPASATIVQAVIGMAHALGLTPVAEGVETAEIAARLREYGCRVAQGFYFSRPLPGPQMLELLRKPCCEGELRAAVSDPQAPTAARPS